MPFLSGLSAAGWLVIASWYFRSSALSCASSTLSDASTYWFKKLCFMFASSFTLMPIPATPPASALDVRPGGVVTRPWCARLCRIACAWSKVWYTGVAGRNSIAASCSKRSSESASLSSSCSSRRVWPSVSRYAGDTHFISSKSCDLSSASSAAWFASAYSSADDSITFMFGLSTR